MIYVKLAVIHLIIVKEVWMEKFEVNVMMDIICLKIIFAQEQKIVQKEIKYIWLYKIYFLSIYDNICTSEEHCQTAFSDFGICNFCENSFYLEFETFQTKKMKI